VSDQEGLAGEGRSRGGGWLTPRRRLLLGIILPVAVSAFSRFHFLSRSANPYWQFFDHAITPTWALAIIVIAGRLRQAVRRYTAPAPQARGRLARRFMGREGVVLAAGAAQAGALLIILATYTRELAWLGREPKAVWFAVLVMATCALLGVPLWSIRAELHRRGTHYLDTGALPRLLDHFFFDDSAGRPARARYLLAFSLVTLAISFTVLGQFDALLRGMHPAGAAPVGINGLASIQEFDLFNKPAGVIDRVGRWRDYTEAVGAEFGSAYGVVTAHAVLDTVITIPAYCALGLILAGMAWRYRHRFGSGTAVRRAFELITLAGLIVLVITALLDVAKNVLTWHVMDRAWNDPAGLPNLSVRLLWGSALVRTVGLWVLAAAALLLMALAGLSTQRLRRILLAVRVEVLLLIALGVVVLMLPQIADMIRGWHMSHTLIAVGLVMVLSMVLRWTAARNLRLQHRQWQQLEEGDAPTPARMRLGRSRPEVGRLFAAALVGLAVVQVALAGAGVPAGRGLLVPAALIVGVALFGLPLPPAPYRRGDRPVDPALRRSIPRMLGAAAYLIVGVAVLKAAATSVAYARHQDWWLVFALVPPAIGLWRIATRTTNTTGFLEGGFAAVVVGLGAAVIAAGDPELSPAALAFAGITFAYGALAFYGSYEPASLVSRISRRWLSPAWAKPFAAAAAAALVATVIWFYVDPISVAPRVGTMGMIVMAAIFATLLGAGAVRLAELSRPPRLLAAFGIKRTPMVALLVVWFLLAPTLLGVHTNDVRLISGVTQAGLGFDDVWQRWAANNLSQTTAATTERPVVPLLLVSSSGGGLRAAAWTSFVLDCIFEGSPGAGGPCDGPRSDGSRLASVALMSGVSGGSLGMAAYLAHVADGFQSEGGNSWVDEVFGDDYLAAPTGWLFFVDLPRSLIGFGPTLPNRSDLMERAWEQSWPGDILGLRRGLGQLWASTSLPPVIFNGTSVNDGCRANISALDVGGSSPEVPSCSGLGNEASTGGLGATYDLVDFLCPSEDVALSTAAGISARFPVISVSARISGDLDGGCARAREGAVFVVDGGYLEGSGAGTLLDTWEALRDEVDQYNTSGAPVCIVPFMLHIDNGYESASVSGNQAVPRELAVPLLTLAHSSSGITAARSEAALAFEAPFTIAGRQVAVQSGADGSSLTSRYARLVTRAHPGVQAPLGWTLSQASIDDLREQLGIAENAAALAEVRAWLAGDLVCLGG
jgi:hypothetical protein